MGLGQCQGSGGELLGAGEQGVDREEDAPGWSHRRQTVPYRR